MCVCACLVVVTVSYDGAWCRCSVVFSFLDMIGMSVLRMHFWLKRKGSLKPCSILEGINYFVIKNYYKNDLSVNAIVPRTSFMHLFEENSHC